MRFETKFWSVDLPDDWEGYDGGFSTTISKKDGIGLVSFSTAVMGAELPRASDPKEVLGSDINKYSATEEKIYGPFKGLRGQFIDKAGFFARLFNLERDIHTVKWTLLGGDILLLASYVCHLPASDAEIAAEEDQVESILETLVRI